MYFEWFTPNRHVPVPRLTPLLFHQWTGNGHRWRVSHTNCTCFQFNSVDWSNDASYAVNNLADVFFAEECFARLWIVKVNKKNVFVCCRVMFRSSLSQICFVENIAAGRVFGDFFSCIGRNEKIILCNHCLTDASGAILHNSQTSLLFAVQLLRLLIPM